MSALGGGANDLAEPASAAGGARDASFALRFGWLAVMGPCSSRPTVSRTGSPRARGGADLRVRLGARDPVRAVDDRAVLVDRPAVCAVVLFWTRRADLLDHVKRLLTVQLISVACFIAWPLRFGFERPDAGGVAGALFTLLMGFDKPFNQAPSLHIGLLVVLWAVYAKHLRGTLARRAAPVVRGDRRVGADHLPASRDRRADRRGRRLSRAVPVSIARCRGPAAGRRCVAGRGRRALARRYALGAAALALVALVRAARPAGRWRQGGSRWRSPVSRGSTGAARPARSEERARAVPGRHALAVRADDRRRIRQFAAMDVPAAGASADRRARVDRAHADDTRRAPPRLHGAGRPDR